MQSLNSFFNQTYHYFDQKGNVRQGKCCLETQEEAEDKHKKLQRKKKEIQRSIYNTE